MGDRQVVHMPFPPSPPPPYGSDPPIWGIVRVHLVPATHAPNFSPIAAIGKKLIFLLPDIT